MTIEVIERMQKAEQALSATLQIPEGWKLVPLDATLQMKQSALEANRLRMSKGFKGILEVGQEIWAAGNVYRAMLDAVPSYVNSLSSTEKK